MQVAQDEAAAAMRGDEEQPAAHSQAAKRVKLANRVSTAEHRDADRTCGSWDGSWLSCAAGLLPCRCGWISHRLICCIRIRT